jgi:hypothetical protein
MPMAGVVVRVFIALGLLWGAPARPQPDLEQQVGQLQFWSGTVVEVTETSLTVRRSSNNAEDRKFAINAETKVEGKIKEQERVTVSFVEVEGEFIAKRVLVREQ